MQPQPQEDYKNYKALAKFLCFWCSWIFYGASEQEAVDRMRATLDRLSVGPGKKRDDIGDEAYFSKTETNDSGVLRFRKANVYVDVIASSAKVAEDLANSIARQIQKE